MKGLAFLAILVGSQAAWMKFCMWSAAKKSAETGDLSVGGAYCAMWMMGIPVVLVASCLLGILVLR